MNGIYRDISEYYKYMCDGAYHTFPEEFNKHLRGDGPLKDFPSDKPVQGQDREEGIPLSPHEARPLYTAHPNGSPAPTPSRRAAIHCTLISEHELSRVSDKRCHVSAKVGAQFIVSLLCNLGNCL